MDTPAFLRQRLAAGGTAVGTMAFEFFTPGLASVLKAAGADFVILDTEHSGVGIETVKAQVTWARGVGLAPFVRVPGCAYHLIAPVLDAGAEGIMVPMLETAEQARDLASWCRYRPEGTRGLGFSIGHDAWSAGDPLAKMRAANDRIVTIALVETPKGIAAIDEIMAVDGIDIGWLGHWDLSDGMGIPGQFDDPRFQAAIDALAGAANRHGKTAGWLAPSAAVAKTWAARGFRCFCIGTDVSLLRDALAREVENLGMS